MKRLFTFFICVLSIQISKAKTTDVHAYGPLPVGDVKPKFQLPDLDTIVPITGQAVAQLAHGFNLFERRLDSIEKDVPLDYNEYVQSYIDTYTRRRDGIAAVLGKSKYYFPIYEKAFREAGIPEEIKYLSIVESELNPLAVSRVGATGPWQFMFATARLYGLTMDNYVDERRDPIEASYAAAAYLRDAYQEFGDWLLAIASYNCGKGNVTRAIEKAGATDFWSIRPYLPNETRNYVPAFIAMTYVMNYYKCHDIQPMACNFSVNTDTVMVNKFVPLTGIAKVLDVSMDELCTLNPAYKKRIINGSTASPRRLVIPQTARENYAALYEALNGPGAGNPQFRLASNPVVEEGGEDAEAKPAASTHKVRRGETLADIADKYGIEVQDIKAWNHLRSTRVKTGVVLKVKASETEETPVVKKIRSFTTYKVKAGDTLSEIAAKFDGVSVEKIRDLNGLRKRKIQPGMLLKIQGA